MKRLLLLLTFAVQACSASIAQPRTAQTRCGVASTSLVTRPQAVCIAAHAGLAQGIEAWSVGEVPYPAANRIEWHVSNRLDASPCAPTPGMVVHINRLGGAVLLVVPWTQCCLPVPDVLPGPDSTLGQ